VACRCRKASCTSSRRRSGSRSYRDRSPTSRAATSIRCPSGACTDFGFHCPSVGHSGRRAPQDRELALAFSMQHAREMSRASLDTVSAPPKATFKDLALLPEEVRAEIVDGEIVEKAAPSFEHANTQLGLGSLIRVEFHGDRGGPRSGGWWILSEVDVELEAHDVYRPDLAGWKRESLPAQPVGRPVRVRPDWVCEVLSRSNAQNDLVKKFRGYHRAGVPHYWI